MKNVLAAPRSAKAPALIGLIFVLPFAILELVSNPLTTLRALHLQHLTSLTVLFGLLWLLPALCFAVLLSIVRKIRSGDRIMVRPVFLLKVIVLVSIAWAWEASLLTNCPVFWAFRTVINRAVSVRLAQAHTRSSWACWHAWCMLGQDGLCTPVMRWNLA